MQWYHAELNIAMPETFSRARRLQKENCVDTGHSCTPCMRLRRCKSRNASHMPRMGDLKRRCLLRLLQGLPWQYLSQSMLYGYLPFVHRSTVHTIAGRHSELEAFCHLQKIAIHDECHQRSFGPTGHDVAVFATHATLVCDEVRKIRLRVAEQSGHRSLGHPTACS